MILANFRNFAKFSSEAEIGRAEQTVYSFTCFSLSVKGGCRRAESFQLGKIRIWQISHILLAIPLKKIW